MPALAVPASISYASPSCVTSASLSAAFTNSFDPLLRRQVQIKCYQTLIQSSNIPLEHVCLCFASHSLRQWFLFGVPPRLFFLSFFFTLPCRFCTLISHLISLSGWLSWLGSLGYPQYVYRAFMFVNDSDNEKATVCVSFLSRFD